MEMAADYHIKLNDSQSAVQFLALEVDRLSRELTAANKSLHSSELAAAEWKSKYEAGQVDLRELEQELLSTRAEADEAEQTVDMVQRDVTQLTRDRASSSAAMTALHDEIAALKNVVNQQKLEKAELESIILNQRYSEHPGNVVAPSANISAIYNRGIYCSSKLSFQFYLHCCLGVCGLDVCHQNFFKSIASPTVFSNSHKTWHT